jgi:hypothetical protein
MAKGNTSFVNDGHSSVSKAVMMPTFHFEESSSASFPDFLNRFFELCESKEEVSEKNFEEENGEQRSGFISNQSVIGFLFYQKSFSEPRCLSSAPRLYILYLSLKIFA